MIFEDGTFVVFLGLFTFDFVGATGLTDVISSKLSDLEGSNSKSILGLWSVSSGEPTDKVKEQS